MARIMVALIAAGLVAVPCRGDDAGANPETLIRLEIDPAPAPSPALRYLLLPELKEMKPGNPIFNYFKCSMEQESFLFDKEAFERRERLLAMPLKELPAQELQEYGRSVLIQADRAARLDKPDWQILQKLKTDGINLLLPDVQQMRALARALQVRFRAEVAHGTVRRRAPDRPDDVRHVAPPGRAPDAHRRPGGHRHRRHGHRPARGDAGAARLPQPLLGADEPAQSR